MTVTLDIWCQRIGSTDLLPNNTETNLFYVKTKSNSPNFPEAAYCTKNMYITKYVSPSELKLSFKIFLQYHVQGNILKNQLLV